MLAGKQLSGASGALLPPSMPNRCRRHGRTVTADSRHQLSKANCSLPSALPLLAAWRLVCILLPL